jgi:CRP-like cAMP-binding protein
MNEPAQEDGMADESAESGLRDRITRQGEDVLGKVAQELLENPMVNSAITRAFGARERAAQAQEAALGALNIPSAADVERLTRRVRSVSQRLEGIEDGVDRLDEHVSSLARESGIGDRLEAIEQRLDALAGEVAGLRDAVAGRAPVPSSQERLEVPQG